MNDLIYIWGYSSSKLYCLAELHPAADVFVRPAKDVTCCLNLFSEDM